MSVRILHKGQHPYKHKPQDISYTKAGWVGITNAKEALDWLKDNPGAGASLAVTLGVGNTTGANDIIVANGQAIQTDVNAGDTCLLQAYDVDGASYTTFATLTANVTPTMALSTSVTHVNWDAAYSHVSNDGSDHSFIDQDVTTSGTPSFTSVSALGIDTGVAAAQITLNGTTLSTAGTDANIILNLNLKGTGGAAYALLKDTNGAGYLAVGSNLATARSWLAVLDGGTNKPGVVQLYKDNGDGQYLWVNTNGILTVKNSDWSSDPDTEGYSLIDFDDGTIGGATQALANGMVATTQSSGDNSTKVATTAYVDAIDYSDVGAIQDSTDTVKDTHIDWGIGVGQVSAGDIPIADGGGIIAATEVEGALQENRGLINTNTSAITALTSSYSRRSAVKGYVDNTAAPPTEVLGDRYILDDTGASHANWDGASALDIVEFDGSVWVATSPLEGYIAYNDDDNKDYLYTDDGAPAWQARATVITNHNDLSNFDGGQAGQYYHLTSAQHTIATQAATAALDGYLTSANFSTFNGKQDALTFGIANTNALQVDDATAADNDYAKFTATGVEGRSYSEVKTDLSLDAVENTAVSTWAGSANITTLGTISSGVWSGTAIEGSAIASTGEAGGTKFLREDGDGTCSWQTVAAGGSVGGVYGYTATSTASNITLVAGTDNMYQWVTPTGSYLFLSLSHTAATAGDRFVIANTAAETSGYYLTIQDAAATIDKIYSGSIKEYIYDGSNWVGAEIGAGKGSGATSIAIGKNAKGYNYSVAIGENSDATTAAIAIGYNAVGGTTYGVGIGYGAQAAGAGVAIGRQPSSGTDGVAVGYQASAGNYGTALGYQASTNSKNYAFVKGYRGTAQRTGEEWYYNGTTSTTNLAGSSTIGFYGQTTNDTATELFLKGVSSNRFTILANSQVLFKAYVTAYNNADHVGKTLEITGTITRDGSNNTALLGAVTSTVINETGVYDTTYDTGNWTIVPTADDTNEALIWTFTGESSKTISTSIIMVTSEVRF